MSSDTLKVVYYRKVSVLEPDYITIGVDVGDRLDSTVITFSYSESPGQPRHVWIIVKPKSALERIASEEDPFSRPPQE
jgi:hypothetical protein